MINKPKLNLPTTPAFPKYSVAELQSFDRELATYWVEKEITYPKKDTVRFVDWPRFLADKGATSRAGAIIFSNSGVRPFYEILRDKIDQWNWWKGGLNYGRSKGFEQVAQVAGKLTENFKQNNQEDFGAFN